MSRITEAHLFARYGKPMRSLFVRNLLRDSLAKLVVIFLSSCPVAMGGAVANQFFSGYEGIPWGTSLTDLAERVPGGRLPDLGPGPADRDAVYLMLEEAPVLGLEHTRHVVKYIVDRHIGLKSVCVTFAYEQRESVMGTLVFAYGDYTSQEGGGAITHYIWRRDHGVTLEVDLWDRPRLGYPELCIFRI